jgi:hypothetical protein
MTTDWALVRTLMDAAISACEQVDRLGLKESDRMLPTGTGNVVVWDVMTSAWTYPENVRYDVVRARHRLGEDAAYPPECARVLREAASVCAELVGASRLDEAAAAGGDQAARRSIRALVEGLAVWYRDQMVPQLTRAVTASHAGDLGDPSRGSDDA